MKRLSFLITVLLLSLVPLSVFAFADTPGAPASGYCKLGNLVYPCPFKTDTPGPAGQAENQGTFGYVVFQVIDLALLAVASIAAIFLVVGGYRYIIAHGNEEKSEAAKKTMTSAVWGLVIVLAAFMIIQVVASILLKGTAGLNI